MSFQHLKKAIIFEIHCLKYKQSNSITLIFNITISSFLAHIMTTLSQFDFTINSEQSVTIKFNKIIKDLLS